MDLDKQTKKYLILTFSDSIINLEKIDKIIGSNIVNQFKGCFCLKNNSKFEHEIEIYNTYRNELIFFKSNEYSKPFLGITSLLEKIIDNVKEYYFINIRLRL